MEPQGKTDRTLGRKHATLIAFFLGLILLAGMSVSCTQMSELKAIFKKDEKPSLGDKKTPLTAVSLAESGVAIDVYVIRIPYDRRELLEQFWQDVEESEIPTNVRNMLFQHGLRQGMLPSKIPVSLERLLDLKKIQPQRPFVSVYMAGAAALEEPLYRPPYRVSMMNKQPFECPTCETIPKLPVLAMVDGQPCGRVYSDAKGMILISTEEQPDGSVLVKTVPEIHYGEEVGKLTSEASEFTRKVYIAKLSFDQLAVETKLLLGQWVVIGPETRSHSGFGLDILRQGQGDPEQILIAIRLRQTRKDGIHDRNDIAITKMTDNATSRPPEDGEEPAKEDEFPASLADQELGKTL